MAPASRHYLPGKKTHSSSRWKNAPTYRAGSRGEQQSHAFSITAGAILDHPGMWEREKLSQHSHDVLLRHCVAVGLGHTGERVKRVRATADLDTEATRFILGERDVCHFTYDAWQKGAGFRVRTTHLRAAWLVHSPLLSLPALRYQVQHGARWLLPIRSRLWGNPASSCARAGSQ